MAKLLKSTLYVAPDDPQLFKFLSTFTQGLNTRNKDENLADDMLTIAINTNLLVGGQVSKVHGTTTVGDDLGAKAICAMGNFRISGGADQFLVAENTTLHKWSGSGNFATIKDDFAASTTWGITIGAESGEGDVAFARSSGNWFRFNAAGTAQDLGDTNTSPPKSNISDFAYGRWLIADGDLVYFSDAFSDDYSDAFDRITNAFRFTSGGKITAILPSRINGANFLTVSKENSLWLLGINNTTFSSSVVEPLDLTKGCKGRRALYQIGDDVWYLSSDGVRSIVKSQLDKARGGSSNPLTFLIKDTIDTINWNYAQNSVMTYYDGMCLLAVPTGSSTVNNTVLIGYPQYIITLGKDTYPSWSVVEGVNVACWEKFFVGGEERLYYGEATADGLVYRFWDDTVSNFNGVAINFDMATKAEDFGYPQQYKYGGEIEIRTDTGSGTVSVYADIDDGGWSALGSFNVAGSGLILPIDSLPFNLDSATILANKFHLDSLGRFRKIKIRLVCNETGSDIKIFSIALASYLDQYEGE